MGRTTAFGAAAAAVVVLGVLLAVANCQNGNMAALELDNATRVYWEDLAGPGASVLNNTYLAGKGHYAPQGTPLMVGLSLIQGAAEIGALCLDGTLPGYHLDKGWGTGADNWLIQLEGGGWCNDLRTCSYRKTSRHGSSRYMERAILFSGILSNKRSENPDFYNWNRVKLRYCDGASFTGDVEGGNEVPRLFFRGQRIWQAGMADLLAQGMNRAKQALLSGCSAGGLAAILHCDEFRELMPQSTKVKCLSDAGMFLDVPDVSGGHTLRAMFHSLVKMQGVAKNLPKFCTSRRDPAQCFFPQYMLRTIKTPLFLLNTAYDSWQVMSSLAPNSADPHGRWRNCKLNPANCNPNQLQNLQGFRMQMLRAVRGFMNSPGKGLFINSCFAHCQTERQDTWFAPNSPRLTKSVAESVGDWYFDRRPVKEVDCAYPCDSSCHNLIFRPE